MSGQGRPFRFLAVLLFGWVTMRAVLLWPSATSIPDAVRVLAPFAGVPGAEAEAHPVLVVRSAPRVRIAIPARRRVAVAATPEPDQRSPDSPVLQRATRGHVQAGPERRYGAGQAMPVQNMPEAVATLAPLASRWSASAWLALRPGTGLGAAPGASQLGGSQAGVRVTWLALPRARVALFGRVTTPLEGKGREAAAGIEWQPFAAPVRLVAEQRFGLDGTKGGSGIGVIAGIDTRLPARFRLEAYGQAGAIQRSRTEPYVDAAARATRSIARAGRAELALGIGGWGAAQRDAARLDLGPSATLALPVGKANVRLAIDWRQRVAGDARPGSGLALVLGSDF
ncbi:hypothetical protein AB2M62_16600 [Sphingomonas sp. MMS12-HWE2-04]|uniref:hypothetical protein n=1 Tax=Sphingomonas sp. MMS12-HWE2-04 TaxID=3234199 RepID=UPI00384CF9A3